MLKPDQCLRLAMQISALTLATVALAFAVAPSAAKTINVPRDAETIQEGLDAASAGDTVMVAGGIYNEHSITMKPGVYMTSETGLRDCVTIDAGDVTGRRVLSCGPSGATTSIVGFTITGGNAADGAGIHCSLCSPTIKSCRLLGNYAYGYGGGVFCSGAAPSIEDCSFEMNTALGGGGGGVSCTNSSSPTLTGCSFSGNASYYGGCVYLEASSATLSGCTFTRNDAINGGGLFCKNGSTPSLINCTFEGNELHEGGCGNAIYCASTSVPVLSACIMAFGRSGEAICCDGAGSVPMLHCCDIYGNPGGNWNGFIAYQYDASGNFSDDPLFCDAANGDLTLDAASPCAGVDNPSCGLIGAWDVGCDSPVRAANWGTIKALYRRPVAGTGGP